MTALSAAALEAVPACCHVSLSKDGLPAQLTSDLSPKCEFRCCPFFLPGHNLEHWEQIKGKQDKGSCLFLHWQKKRQTVRLSGEQEHTRKKKSNSSLPREAEGKKSGGEKVFSRLATWFRAERETEQAAVRYKHYQLFYGFSRGEHRRSIMNHPRTGNKDMSIHRFVYLGKTSCSDNTLEHWRWKAFPF